MLSQFANEVLSNGPVAVLPQNLSEKWLKRTQKQCDDFFDQNFSEEECRTPEDLKGDILIASVHELLRYQRGEDFQIDFAELVAHSTIYAVSVTMESVHRESGIGLTPPDLNNIFDVDRIVAFKEKNPDFIKLIENVCIIRDAKGGWLQSIKNKVLSTVLSA